MENIEQNLHLLHKDITEGTVIHLRLGDVISGYIVFFHNHRTRAPKYLI